MIKRYGYYTVEELDAICERKKVEDMTCQTVGCKNIVLPCPIPGCTPRFCACRPECAVKRVKEQKN